MRNYHRKSLAVVQAEAAEEGVKTLRRSLGAFNLVFLGIGVIIGAGLFSLTGIAAAENAGPAVSISFLLAALACAFAGICSFLIRAASARRPSMWCAAVTRLAAKSVLQRHVVGDRKPPAPTCLLAATAKSRSASIFLQSPHPACRSSHFRSGRRASA